MQWFGPKDFITPHAMLDLRMGFTETFEKLEIYLEKM